MGSGFAEAAARATAACRGPSTVEAAKGLGDGLGDLSADDVARLDGGDHFREAFGEPSPFSRASTTARRVEFVLRRVPAAPPALGVFGPGLPGRAVGAGGRRGLAQVQRVGGAGLRADGSAFHVEASIFGELGRLRVRSRRGGVAAGRSLTRPSQRLLRPQIFVGPDTELVKVDGDVSASRERAALDQSRRVSGTSAELLDRLRGFHWWRCRH